MDKQQFFNMMKSMGRTDLDDNDYFAYQLGLKRGAPMSRTAAIRQQTALQQQQIANQIKKAGMATRTKRKLPDPPRQGANNTMTYEQFANMRKRNFQDATKTAYNHWLSKFGHAHDSAQSETEKHNQNIHNNKVGGQGIKKSVPSEVHNNIVGKGVNKQIPLPKNVHYVINGTFMPNQSDIDKRNKGHIDQKGHIIQHLDPDSKIINHPHPDGKPPSSSSENQFEPRVDGELSPKEIYKLPIPQRIQYAKRMATLFKDKGGYRLPPPPMEFNSEKPYRGKVTVLGSADNVPTLPTKEPPKQTPKKLIITDTPNPNPPPPPQKLIITDKQDPNEIIVGENKINQNPNRRMTVFFS
jgi:hypothetical protein